MPQRCLTDLKPDRRNTTQTTNSRQAVYHDQLQDLYGACRQVLDATVITLYQRMVLHALSVCGGRMTFANRLGQNGDAAIPQAQPDQTYDWDVRMTDITTDGWVNKAAA